MPVLSISSFHVRESLYTQSEISFSDNNWIRKILCSKTSTWFKIIVLNLYASFFVLENDSLTKRQKNLSATLLCEEVGGGGGGICMNESNKHLLCVCHFDFETLSLGLGDISVFTWGKFKCKSPTPLYVDHFYWYLRSQINNTKTNKKSPTYYCKLLLH